MNYKEETENIKKQISKKILFNKNLSKLSWFNLGGPAKMLFKPDNLQELSFFLKRMSKKNNIKVLGMGSNILIRDGGYEGTIIKLGKNFSRISILNNNFIICGASAKDKVVSNFALDNSISGFEFLSCIPGSIGGAIRMNSGCFDEDISKILVSVQAIDLNGNLRLIPSSKIKFCYRGSNLGEDLIFISATFSGIRNKKADIREKMDKYLMRKKNAQPSNIKTCGSTFKNPQNNQTKKAWQLIKLSSCHKMKVGGAAISEKHCNFFVNTGSATAKDLENLIIKVRREVFVKTGIKLETEIQIIGRKR